MAYSHILSWSIKQVCWFQKVTSAKNVVFHLHVHAVTCGLQSSTTNGRFMIIKLIVTFVKLPTLSDPSSAIVAVSTFYTEINSPSLLPSPSNNDGKLHTLFSILNHHYNTHRFSTSSIAVCSNAGTANSIIGFCYQCCLSLFAPEEENAQQHTWYWCSIIVS